MAKSLLRIEARQMRAKGKSVKGIAHKLNISKSTVSLWVRDIILSVEQIEQLRKRALKGAELGRFRSALMQKHRRLKLLDDSRQEGIKKLKNLTDREFLIAGVALYWAEGSRKTQSVEFCNADPKLIKFMVDWSRKIFGIEIADLKAAVGINEIHRQRENVVKEYWSKVSGIPLTQFCKTSFKKVKNQKVYENFNEHYGTLRVRILKASRFYYKIMGLIDGLDETGRGLVSQGAS